MVSVSFMFISDLCSMGSKQAHTKCLLLLYFATYKIMSFLQAMFQFHGLWLTQENVMLLSETLVTATLSSLIESSKDKQYKGG